MEESLDKLVDKNYQEQDVKLSSTQINSILVVFRSSINKLRSRDMNKMADRREEVLRSIIDKLK
jgi:hypothetical protein